MSFPFNCAMLGFFNKERMSIRRFYSEDDQYMILISDCHKTENDFLLTLKRRFTEEERWMYDGQWMNLLGDAVITQQSDLIELLRGAGFPVDANIRKYRIDKMLGDEKEQ